MLLQCDSVLCSGVHGNTGTSVGFLHSEGNVFEHHYHPPTFHGLEKLKALFKTSLNILRLVIDPTKIFYVVCLQREPFISLHLLSHKSHMVVVSQVPIWSSFTLVPILKKNGNKSALVRPTPLQWVSWALKFQCWLLMYLIFCLSPHGWNMSEE